jgi:hypothetical protein
MGEFVFEFRGSTADRDREARHLAAWLNDSSGLRGAARVRMVAPGPGEQGGAADAALVLSSMAPLAAPFFGWLSERVKSRRISLRITKDGRDGHPLEINVETPADVQAVVKQVTRLLDEEERD